MLKKKQREKVIMEIRPPQASDVPCSLGPKLWELVRKGRALFTHSSLLSFLPYSLICSPSAPVSSDRSVSSSSSPDEMASAQSNHGYCHPFANRTHSHTVACTNVHAVANLHTQICIMIYCQSWALF